MDLIKSLLGYVHIYGYAGQYHWKHCFGHGFGARGRGGEAKIFFSIFTQKIRFFMRIKDTATRTHIPTFTHIAQSY